MTHNPNHAPANHIDVDFVEGEKELIPVSVEQGMGVQAVKVTLEGNREEGGALVDVETGESLLNLAGSEDSDDERAAA